MSTGRDDDALSWGEEDPTLETGAPPLPAGFTAVGRGSEAVSAPATAAAAAPLSPSTERNEDAAPAASSNTALVTLGVFAGIYLLLSAGWIIGGLRLEPYARFLVAQVGYQVSLWLAVLAPAIWFVTTVLLTRGAKAWIRILLLLLGALLLLPWPFIMLGVVGQ